MNLRNRLTHMRKAQHQLIKNSAEEILDSNYSLLRHMIRIGLAITCFMVVVVSFTPGYTRLKVIYGIMMACSLMLWMFFRREGHKRYTLAGLYFIFAVFLGLTVYLSVVASPGQMGVSIIALLCLAPLAFLDESWRIDGFMILFFLLHTVCSALVKLPITAFQDGVNGLCFTFIGILLGEHVRSIKLENYEVKRKAQLQIDQDFLTGLYNRRKMFELLERHKLGGREKQIEGIIMLDIDHFKEYNDHYGHVMGDDCLRRLSTRFVELSSQMGLDFFRYGGEEFLAFCYEGQGRELCEISEAIRRAIYEMALPFPDSDLGRVTISLGFAVHSQNQGLVNDQLVMMADKALYAAKEQGRNKSVAYHRKSC